nr:MAG TPA: hypothetical protein [Caudoviricetes sp.]
MSVGSNLSRYDESFIALTAKFRFTYLQLCYRKGFLSLTSYTSFRISSAYLFTRYCAGTRPLGWIISFHHLCVAAGLTLPVLRL